jgi:hypothetical protein
MQGVAHLKAMAAEAKVLERAARRVRMQPIGEDSLLGGSELAGAGEDPHSG